MKGNTMADGTQQQGTGNRSRGDARPTMNVDELVPRLREAYGDALRCALVYGSAATPGASTAAKSPAGGREEEAHVLVIADALSVEALVRAARVIGEWVAAGHPAPLTLTTAEWRSSADVFAIEYAEVLEQHRLLHGTLPMDGVRVRPEDIRRELEEQVLGKLLKLRRGIMEAGGDASRERTLLELSLSTFTALFRAVVRLHGERAPTEDAAVVARTGQLAGFDPAPFVRVVRHVRGEVMLQPGDARATLAGYLAGLERLIAFLDQFTPGA
jgi:hypothetical protein